MTRYSRAVEHIEKCFRIYAEKDDVQELTFHTIKDWINSNTKDGITTHGLANLLRRRPQFRRLRTERLVGSNLTTSFWAMRDSQPKTQVVREGWVTINDPKDEIPRSH